MIRRGGRELKKQKDTSFLARMILFFRGVRARLGELKPLRRIRDRQRALSHYSDSGSCEESRLSYAFGIAKIISILCLSLLLIITLLFGSRVISYDKVYYMFKDIGYIKSFDEGTPDELSFSKPVQNQVFGNFKNGLIVAGDSEIKLFTSTGRVTLTAGSDFTNPRIETSKEYALIYDQGRNHFSVYNSFVSLYSEQTDYPIACADMSESGAFLIVTKSKIYNSVVKIYGNDFTLLSEYSKNDLVISASLSSDGRYAAVLSLDASNGSSAVTLNILDCKRETVVATSKYEGYMPYRCDFLSSDRVVMFFDDCFIVANRKGETVNKYDYPASAERIDIMGDTFAIIFSQNGKNGKKTLEVFGGEGNKSYTDYLDGSVKDMRLADGSVYVLESREIIRINTSLGTRTVRAADADGLKVVVFPDGRAAVCSQTNAKYISFN